MSKRYEWINGETYCDSDQMYDNETGNKTQPVYVADLLNEQDQKIKDLEAKLAESENKVKGFVELFDKKQHENYEQFCEIMQLKQQLAEKDKEETKKMEDFEKWCQEYYKSNQTAIAELEKALNNINHNTNCTNEGCVPYDGIEEIIDQQIKELKGKVEDE